MILRTVLFSDIASPSSLQQRSNGLRHVKNEVIGNRPKKEAWIRSGIVPLLTNILSSSITQATTLYEDERQILLHSIAILGSLFHDTLRASAVLVQVLSLAQKDHTISLAVLRALNNIANSLQPFTYVHVNDDNTFINLLYSQNSLESLCHMLQDSSVKQTELVSHLIIASCLNETCKARAAASGLLESMISKLKPFILAGNDVPSAIKPGRSFSQELTSFDSLRTQLCSTITCITTIVQGSTQRTILALEAFAKVYGSSIFAHAGSETQVRHSWLHLVSLQNRQSMVKDWSKITNSFLSNQYEFEDDSVIEQGQYDDYQALSGSGSSLRTKIGDWVLQWLLRVLQTTDKSIRLTAIRLTVIFIRSDSSNQLNEGNIIASFVPTIVQMLEPPPEYDKLVLQEHEGSLKAESQLRILEQAPSVLATCMDESLELQRVASDAGAIPKLAHLLKLSHDNISEGFSRKFWQPKGLNIEVSTSLDSLPSDRNIKSPSRSTCHQWSLRQGTLKAIAIITSQNDEYRKAVIEHASVPLIVESLLPLNEIASSRNKSDQSHIAIHAKVGNPVPVLVSACEAAKALCRSVGTLQTTLNDANLATPLAALLDHSNIEVQIAATAAMVNVVLEFSPMRQAAVEAGVVRILCNHARSTSPALRLNSLWALKHLVHSAPNDLKTECMHGLGKGWLEDALRPLQRPSSEARHGSSKHIDRTDDHFMGSTDGSIDNCHEHEEVHMIAEPSLNDQLRSDSTEAAYNVSRTDMPREFATRQMGSRDGYSKSGHSFPSDDVAIRVQSLDFVRNLLAGHRNHEMADYIVRELGHEKFISLLADLLSSTSAENAEVLRFTSPAGKVPLHEVVVAVLTIICNFAGARPRHRQHLISSASLLQQLRTLFRHSCKEIRKACVWIVINLTWTDDQEDRLSCKTRAVELRKNGILEELRQLIDDTDLDVQERAKMAFIQINEQLER